MINFFKKFLNLIKPTKSTNEINWFNGFSKEGHWIHHDSYGDIISEGYYINDLREGYWETYYSNGKLFDKGNYRNGLADGYWETYYENGKLEIQEIFI